MAFDYLGLASQAAPAIGSMFGPIGSMVGGLAGTGLGLLGKAFGPKDTTNLKNQIGKQAQAEASKYGIQLPSYDANNGGVQGNDPAFGNIFMQLAKLINGGQPAAGGTGTTTKQP